MVTVVIHYECLRVTSVAATELPVPRRAVILVIIAGVLLAHVIEVTLYAVAYYAGQVWLGLGRIDGELEGGLLDFFYFSIATFTTLGIGDLHPRGPLRLMVGFQSLNGLVLIGWSASFTYLSMERFWEDAPAEGPAAPRTRDKSRQKGQ